MENNKDEVLDKTLTNGIHGTEVFELGYLVNVILDYYISSEPEEGEDWKKGTALEKEAIPKKLDDLIGKAFEAQLKKFSK